MTILSRACIAAAAASTFFAASSAVQASSHREAPFITEQPKVDGTDFYMFRSYDPNLTDDFVTIIANYQPLQDAYGGPNYFFMDPEALYEIHIDNDGDAVEDITFQFRFTNEYRNAALPIGPGGADVTLPFTNVGPNPATGDGAATVGPGINDNAGLNVIENYTVGVVRGDRRSAEPDLATNGGSVNQSNALPDSNDNTLFRKPVDNIGSGTIPNYGDYADNHVFNISVPGCATPGRVFAGQRREGFVVNLGEVFDRISLNPLGERDQQGTNIVANKNITSLALELPVECLTNGSEPVIGGWTSASLRQGRLLNPQPQGPTSRVGTNSGDTGPTVEGGAWTQVSRLGSPLVNEVVIGIDAKDRFNASEPVNDLDPDVGFGAFVLYPTLPEVVNLLFSVPAPATPRNDLVAAFVTGIRTDVNSTPTNFTQPQAITDGTGQGGEMLRLNTAFPGAAPPVLAGQDDLGFLACDLYGFPNGRRPADDVVDIALSVAMGALTGDNGVQSCDVSGPEPVLTPDATEGGAIVNDNAAPDLTQGTFYLNEFPYLAAPLPGSPNPSRALR